MKINRIKESLFKVYYYNKSVFKVYYCNKHSLDIILCPNSIKNVSEFANWTGFLLIQLEHRDSTPVSETIF
jgi:hypothetical protein